MAVIIQTDDPSGLLKSIYEGIDSGSIKTWAYNKNGSLTHNTLQWKARAWFRPKVQTGELIFGLTPSVKEPTIQWPTYTMYHGHLIYTLLYHFDEKFVTANVTALLSPDDHPTNAK